MKKTVVVFLLIILSSCVSKKKYDDLEARYFAALQEHLKTEDNYKNLLSGLKSEANNLNKEIASLKNEIANQEAKISDYEKNLQDLQNEFDALAQDNSKAMAENAKRNKELLAELQESRALLTEKENQLRDKISRVQELENLLKEQRNQLSNLKNSISSALRNFEGKGITVQEKDGRIYVSMDNKLLFASGKWEVQPEGVNALNDLGKVLKTQPDLSILIEGHTDNVPYTARQQIKDNWDLSVMRATAITKILQNQGVSPKQMVAGGRGEYLPVASNDEKEGRAKNRRVEIILTPNLDKINKLLNSI